MESKFRGKGTTTIIMALFKSNARDVPALKLEYYAILGVTGAALALTNNLIICFSPAFYIHYNFVFFTFGVFL